MKQLIISLFIVACTSPQNRQTEITVQDSLSKADTLNIQPSIATENIVTAEFLDLVEFLDSSGFIFDSSRFSKTYKEINQTRPIKINNYLFYELKLNETVPIIEYAFHFQENDSILRKDSAQHKSWLNWKDRWEVNKQALGKVEKIMAYFYIDKSFFKGTRSKPYYDGIIEEWTFPDSISARIAAFDLARKETMVYINRGAYVGFLDNHMFVFHSRSAGFYTPLKSFINYFSKKHHVILPHRGEQRRVY